MPSRRVFLGGVGVGLATAWSCPSRAMAAPAVEARGPVLGPLLARNRERHTGAARGANHASMALLALASLGATPSQLVAFGEGLLRKGKPFPSGGGSLTRETWRASLGDMEALPAFRRLFTEEIARHGVARPCAATCPS